MCRLRQPINDHPNQITYLHSLRQSSDKIHKNAIPITLWHKQRFHQTRRLLMFNHGLLTHLTSIHKLNYILLHSRPPKQPLQILIHHRRFWMNTQTTSVNFQNPLLKFRYIWFANPIMQHQNTILIQSELHSFTLINQHHTIYKFLNFLQNVTFLNSKPRKQ